MFYAIRNFSRQLACVGERKTFSVMSFFLLITFLNEAVMETWLFVQFIELKLRFEFFYRILKIEQETSIELNNENAYENLNYFHVLPFSCITLKVSIKSF
jgi:hypothetical protein